MATKRKQARRAKAAKPAARKKAAKTSRSTKAAKRKTAAAKKKSAKKSPAKKSTARSSGKAALKKSTARKAAPKRAAKKAAKKSTARSSGKKVARKSAVKKVVRKAALKKSAPKKKLSAKRATGPAVSKAAPRKKPVVRKEQPARDQALYAKEVEAREHQRNAPVPTEDHHMPEAELPKATFDPTPDTNVPPRGQTSPHNYQSERAAALQRQRARFSHKSIPNATGRKGMGRRGRTGKGKGTEPSAG